MTFFNHHDSNLKTAQCNEFAPQDCWHHFDMDVDDYSLPARFTFPFYYEPHPLTVLAAKQVQAYLEEQQDWQHNFGLEGELKGAIGKMFGVLVVQNNKGEIGFLAGFSGKLAERNLLQGFVPPVFDMLTEESFFHGEQLAINQLTEQLEALQASPQIAELKAQLTALKQQSEQEIQAFRLQVIESRKNRKNKRAEAETHLPIEQIAELNELLAKESVAEKNQLKALKLQWLQESTALETQLNELLKQIADLKTYRAQQSNLLQTKLFAQYRFLNQAGEYQDLNQLFIDAPNKQPPAGAGECAAPKLLQFAFLHDLKPIAMAEFWWGASPKSEIKQHRQFYPACQGKCKPILRHMLKGIAMDDDPLLTNPAADKVLTIIYQDDAIVVVNKPTEFLSVPGKSITDSVYSRMKQQFPDATGPLIVHRLDMSTSGLMVIALSCEANRALVQQFIDRTVEKRYVAKLTGIVKGEEGEINLPLRVDLNDRPRQLVCYEHGKSALTYWKIKQRDENHTWLYLYPKTGRTHQLRVHCAHQAGLNIPIMGDDLYGLKSNRLHLHAQRLVLNHPVTSERLAFEVDADF